MTTGRRLAAAPLLAALLVPAAACADTDRVSRGAWSYFGDPRAVYARGQTFFGWATPNGLVQVGSIDRRGRVRRSTLDYMGSDDHNHPSLIVRRDGRIAAFYAPHQNHLVPRVRRYRMYYRVSRRPYDIRAWGPVRTLPRNTPPLRGQPQRGANYPNPIQMKNGQVWLFWRGGSWWPSFSWTKDFQVWSKPRNVVRAIPGKRPYVKYASDGKNVYMAFTQAHPNRGDTSMYFLRIGQDGTIHDDRGKRVGTIARGVDYRRAGVVYRYSRKRGDSWPMDVAVGPDRHPVVVYVRQHPREHRGVYHYARWTGKRWEDRDVVPAGKGRGGGFYFGGASLDHEDPSVVYVSRRSGHALAEVEIWRTPDGGRTWSTTAVTRRSRTNNWRPISPLGHPGNPVLWFNGRYDSFLDFSTTIFAADGITARTRRGTTTRP
ncbi:MAG TPA: BNR-4 repeat-containing protein [Thermoleophilaceae bacterium]